MTSGTRMSAGQRRSGLNPMALTAQYAESRIPSATVTRFGPGQEAQPHEFSPGDFILTHGDSFFSRLIQVGQRLRFWGKDRTYVRWNHAAVVVSGDGRLVEALGIGGVQERAISEYSPTEYHLVHLSL